jgi:hypothetical protein
VRGVSGGAPGLYSGNRNSSSCDVERQIKALQAEPARNRAFASVQGIEPSGVPAYLRSLTPVQLRMDTRVTNHGYRDGSARAYQAVLQSGTAVLVDGHGTPRVRCACGNPLTPAVAQQGTPKRTGRTWPGYRSSNVVVVQPAPVVVKAFVLYDPDDRDWFVRKNGDKGRHDKPTRPPASPTPTVTVSTPAAPTPCPSGAGASATGCPSSSKKPTKPGSSSPDESKSTSKSGSPSDSTTKPPSSKSSEPSKSKSSEKEKPPSGPTSEPPSSDEQPPTTEEPVTSAPPPSTAPEPAPPTVSTATAPAPPGTTVDTEEPAPDTPEVPDSSPAL